MSAAARARLLDEAAVMRSQYVRRGIRDITQPFTDACGLLHQGELVKDEFFTLFEAVGALEVGPPNLLITEYCHSRLATDHGPQDGHRLRPIGRERRV